MIAPGWQVARQTTFRRVMGVKMRGDREGNPVRPRAGADAPKPENFDRAAALTDGDAIRPPPT
jgi:hypothetical protein